MCATNVTGKKLKSLLAVINLYDSLMIKLLKEKGENLRARGGN